MSWIISLLTSLLNIDKVIGNLIIMYGVWVYFILFFVIFVETGLVFVPFLPGDSLIFVAGAFAAGGLMNVFFLFVVLALAAILGDTANYWIGNFLGRNIEKRHWINQESLEKTQNFYVKHGGKTIVLARFVPIVRTFAPFVAGVGKMDYWKFLLFNVIGALAWVALMLTSGYFFGTIPFVKNNLTLVILVIVFISLIPPFVGWIRSRR